MKTKPSKLYLSHDWLEKPKNVHAYTTLSGESISGEKSIDEKLNPNSLGFSSYGAFNLATHVDDNVQTVESNRQQLLKELSLPLPPVWLDQIHSNKVFCADRLSYKQQLPPQADAVYSNVSNVVCAVLTADCLPVFFCDQAGTEIAVAHAGWRGLHAGILSKTIESMETDAENILAYLGPAIGPQSFEVGEEVFQAFVESNEANRVAFVQNQKGHYLCDLYQLARVELDSVGVKQISGGSFCTYTEKRFYSYRRQNVTGRMASLIWLD